jgi:phosphonate C-P lyase system protein PhnG
MPETHRTGEAGAPALKAALQEVVDAATPEEAAELLDRLFAALPLAVTRPAQPGLVMIAALDPFETPFYLGELLVTTAEAALDGFHGQGTVSGEAPECALLLAAVEAAELAGRGAELAFLAEAIAALGRRKAEREALAARIAGATAVSFESMQKERVDFGSLGD